MSTARLLILHARTPLHVGTGRGEGLVDLPVARDVVTGHPLVPGSGVKGPLRAACPKKETREQVFGPDPLQAHHHGSAVRFSDARLLALPVPSDFGTFAWVTSPLVLARWRRDAAGVPLDWPSELPDVPADHAACLSDSALVDGQQLVLDGQAWRRAELDPAWADLLAGLAFPDDPTWQDMLRKRLAVLPDDAFDALCQTGTDVRAHIRIDPDSGTVKGGALWYEESVPAESLFASVVHFVENGKVTPADAEAELASLLGSTLSFGGSKTTGMGLVRGHLHGGAR